MESKIVRAIGLKTCPVAVLWTDERPQEGVHFQEGKVNCVGPMLVAASKGRTAYLDQKSLGCPGGKGGLGFGFDGNDKEFRAVLNISSPAVTRNCTKRRRDGNWRRLCPSWLKERGTTKIPR